jgi:hypothetical protein
MGLEETLFDENDILSYANAAIKIGDKVLEFGKKKAVNVLVPSRGSYPLWNLARKYIYLTGRPQDFEQVKVGDFSIPFIFPEESYQNGLDLDPTKVTRDIILPVSSFEDSLAASQKLRSFWIGVYDAIQKKQWDNLDLKFYKHILGNVSRFLTTEERISEEMKVLSGKSQEGNTWMEPIDKYIPGYFSERKTILVDTVMSGTCIRNLIDALEQRRMDFHAIIVTDNNGKDVKPQNRAYLNELKVRGNVTEIPVPNLFTEDNGPGLLGVTTVVYPSIMEQVAKMKEFKDKGFDFAGAACWMPVPLRTLQSKKLINVSLSQSAYSVSQMLGEALGVEMTLNGHNFSGVNPIDLIGQFEKTLEKVVKFVKEQKLLDANNTLGQYKTFLREISGIEDITTTRSHVLKVNYSKERASRIVSDFYKSLR